MTETDLPPQQWRAQRLLRYRTLEFPYLLRSQFWGTLQHDTIEAWLQNFRDDPDVQFYAAHVLANTVYYPEAFIRRLYRKAFRDLIAWSKVRAHLADTFEDEAGLDGILQDFLAGVVVVPLMDQGRPSESAPAVTRLIKKEGLVDDSQICYAEHLPRYLPGAHTVIIVDDNIGSGQQVVDFWRKPQVFNFTTGSEKISLSELAGRYPDKSFCVVVFAGVKHAIDNLNTDLAPLQVLCPELLDERHRVFSDNSEIWKNPEEKNKAQAALEKFCAARGIALRGFRDMDYAYASQIGTPDWSLPLLRHKGSAWNQLLT